MKPESSNSFGVLGQRAGGAYYAPATVFPLMARHDAWPYRRPSLLFNNHLLYLYLYLYLVDVLTWTRVAGALGFKLSDPLDFTLAVDTMNCLAAAGCMAVLYWIIPQVTSSWKL